MSTAKKKAPSRSLKARAMKAVAEMNKAYGWQGREAVLSKYKGALPPKAVKALQSLGNAIAEADRWERAEYSSMLRPEYDYGNAELSQSFMTSVRRAKEARKAARTKVVKVAAGKTRKARKVAKKKPTRGKKK
jgi:hypothetical protein